MLFGIKIGCRGNTAVTRIRDGRAVMNKPLFHPISALLVAASLVLQPMAWAASGSPSEMLEKGIYTEETKGDIDSAMAIYRELVAEAKSGQSLAAQAQFRLGQCLLKKKRTDEAAEAFKRVIRDYPDEKELVAKARALLPAELALGPIPWENGERLQMKLKLPSGVELGAMTYWADFVETNGRKTWRVGAYTNLPGMNAISNVEVDAETFRPITSRWKHALLGDVSATYGPTEVECHRVGGDEPFTISVDQQVFDNEQFVHTLRRLPLAEGYKTTIPTIATLGAKAVLPIGVEVAALEKADVPAGSFNCYKVKLSIGQTFWISDDPHHYAVKFEAGGAVGMLTSISVRKPGELAIYQDNEFGISFKIPTNWMVDAFSRDGNDVARLLFVDPNADVMMAGLSLVQTDSLSANSRTSPRAWAEHNIKGDARNVSKDAKVRDNSWKNYVVAGRPGISYLFDFVENEKRRTRFSLHVIGPKYSEQFVLVCDTDKFDELLKSFEQIITSYRTTK